MKQVDDFGRGVQKGIEIARQMLCHALKQECGSLGEAIAKVDVLLIDKNILEKRVEQNG